MASGTSLSRAQLLIREPPSTVGAQPGGTIAQIRFQFNPNRLSMTKTTEWRRKPARMAKSAAVPEFAGAGPRSLTLEMLLDATANHDDSVERQIEQLMTACVPTPKSLSMNKPASPWVRFDWGTARTTSFDGVLSSLSISYTLFDVDGKPLRATCSLSIDEATVDEPGQNPTSGALEATRTHQVVTGDRLAHIAWREYGDATAWRLIAAANDIDDPMYLAPGRELLVPAASASDPDGDS